MLNLRSRLADAGEGLRRSISPAGLHRQVRELAINRRRLAAVVLLGATLGVLIVILILRGSASGSDAAAYWHGVRTWLAGGNPYEPNGEWLPWVYAPWLLPLFTPWALLPWEIAWPLWRIVTIGLMLLTLRWAFERRPMATAVAVALLSVPMGIALDTGNVVLLCAVAVWAAQFSDSIVGGLLWGFATATKWFPLVLWPILPRRARSWGVVFAAIAILLSLATWPWTLQQIADVRATGIPHATSLPGLRLDHLSILWAALPWLWRSGLPWIEARSSRPLARARARARSRARALRTEVAGRR